MDLIWLSIPIMVSLFLSLSLSLCGNPMWCIFLDYCGKGLQFTHISLVDSKRPKKDLQEPVQSNLAAS